MKSRTISSLFLIDFVLKITIVSSNPSEFDYTIPAEVQRAHYALNHKKAEQLALTEESISVALSGITILAKKNVFATDFNHECNKIVERYLREFATDTEALGGKSGYVRAKMVSENPLLLYRMIRRIVLTLLGEIIQQCRPIILYNANMSVLDFEAAIYKRFEIPGLEPPTNDDLEDALLGLLRIHYIYGFNAITQLHLGIFNEVHTNVTLGFDECLHLGIKALGMGANVLAYQWIQSANLTLARETKEEKKQFALVKLTPALNELMKRFKVGDIDTLHTHMEKRTFQESVSSNFFNYDYYETCRQESLLSEVETQDLKCFSEGHILHPYWTIQPLKMELLHKDPDVWKYHNFIGKQTSSYIKKFVYENDMLTRSGMISESGRKTLYSVERTSVQAWLYDSEDDDPGQEIVRLNKKIEFCTGFHLIRRGASQALQIVDYSSLGGHYDFHDDSMLLPNLIEQDGDRIATFFLFLSNVTMGGFTAFSDLGIGVKPEAGSAILWFSQYRNGNPDQRHTHGGCPVILGSKLAANKWIMQYENMFRYQCSLNPDL